MQPYPAGLPDRFMGPAMSGSDKNADGRYFPAIAARERSLRETYKTLLANENMQDNQIVPYRLLEGKPVVLLLPNRASIYHAVVDNATLERHQNASLTAITEFQLDSVRIMRTDEGEPALVINVTPISTAVS